MMDSILKFLDFMSKKQKILIAPVFVAFPLVYICFFICIDNFADYAIFDRVIFTITGSVIEVVFSYVACMTLASKVNVEYVAETLVVGSIAFVVLFAFAFIGIIFTPTIFHFLGFEWNYNIANLAFFALFFGCYWIISLIVIVFAFRGRTK